MAYALNVLFSSSFLLEHLRKHNKKHNIIMNGKKPWYEFLQSETNAMKFSCFKKLNSILRLPLFDIFKYWIISLTLLLVELPMLQNLFSNDSEWTFSQCVCLLHQSLNQDRTTLSFISFRCLL
mgnify:CR=1 FL=1